MIQTRYVVSRDEWREAQILWAQRACRKLPGTKGVKWIGLLLGIPIGLSLQYIPHWLTALFIFYLVSSYLFDRWRKKAIREFLYTQATDRGEETDLTVDDDGYRTERPGFNECWMKWRCFTGWREGRSVFVLGRNTQFCIVPKSCLTNEQQVELRDILKSRLAAV